MSDNKFSEAEIETATNNGRLAQLLSDAPFGSHTEIGQHLASLHSKGKMDGFVIFEAELKAFIPALEERPLLKLFVGFSENLEGAPVELFHLLNNISAQLGSSSNYQLSNAVLAWAERNPQHLEAFLEVSFGPDEVAAFSLPVARALLEQSAETVPQKIQTVLMSEKAEAVNIALMALGGSWAKYQPNDEALEQLLLKPLASESPEVREIAGRRALYVVSDNQPATLKLQSELLEHLATLNGSALEGFIREAAYMLDRLPSGLRAACIDVCRTITVGEANTLNAIDHILYQLDLTTDKDDILEIFENLLPQSEAGKIFKTLDSFASKLRGDTKFCWYVLHFLLAGTPRHVGGLPDLFAPIDENIYPFDVASMALTAPEIFYLARKVCGHFLYTRGPAVSVLSACLLALPLKDRRELESFILSFWLKNYPRDIELFEKARTVFKGTAFKNSVERLKVEVAAKEADIVALPENKAVALSERQRQVQAEVEYQRSVEIHENANQQSVFASMFKKKIMLYGSTAVVHVLGKKDEEPSRQTINMNSYETVMPIPQMSRFCPILLSNLLVRFRAERQPS